MTELAVVKVTRTGQMRIPQELREALGIEPGDDVVLRSLMGGIFISKVSMTPQVRADDVLHYLVVSLGQAAEHRGFCEDEHLDPIIEDIQQRVYQDRYGG
jgi:AbrB family looped-hinge helix DNA binding protein